MRKESQIKTSIRGIGVRQRNTNVLIAECAIECAGHAHQHGRATLAEYLFDQTKGIDRHALVSWFHTYTCVKLDKDGKATINKAKRADFDGDGDALIAELREVEPWYDCVKDMATVAKDLDAAARIRALAKSINDAPKKDRKVKVNSAEIREALRELQLALESAREINPVSEPAQIETVDNALVRELRMVA